MPICRRFWIRWRNPWKPRYSASALSGVTKCFAAHWQAKAVRFLLNFIRKRTSEWHLFKGLCCEHSRQRTGRESDRTSSFNWTNDNDFVHLPRRINPSWHNLQRTFFSLPKQRGSHNTVHFPWKGQTKRITNDKYYSRSKFHTRSTLIWVQDFISCLCWAWNKKASWGRMQAALTRPETAVQLHVLRVPLDGAWEVKTLPSDHDRLDAVFMVFQFEVTCSLGWCPCDFSIELFFFSSRFGVKARSKLNYLRVNLQMSSTGLDTSCVNKKNL